MGVALGGVTLPCPAESGECEGAIEARVAIHEGCELVVGILAALEFRIGVLVGSSTQLLDVGKTSEVGYLAVGHGEQLDECQTGALAATADVGGTYGTLPGVILLIVEAIAGNIVMQGHKDCLRILVGGEELSGKVGAVDVRSRLVEPVSAGADAVELAVHLRVGSLPAALVVLAVEDGASPQQQHATFEGQCGAGGDASVVLAGPSATHGLGSQHACRLVEVVEDEFDGLTGGRTRGVILGHGVEHVGDDGHTAVPLDEVVVAPCTEEVHLSEQGSLLLL